MRPIETAQRGIEERARNRNNAHDNVMSFLFLFSIFTTEFSIGSSSHITVYNLRHVTAAAAATTVAVICQVVVS